MLKLIRNRSGLLLAGLVAALAPMLMAPTGGYPSNPTFQSATVLNGLTAAGVTATGTVQGANVTATGTVQGANVTATTASTTPALTVTNFLKCGNTGTSGRQCDFVGTTNTSAAVAYMGIVDQAGTRYGYWGKSSAGSNVSYESDGSVQLIANNGADSILIDAAHNLTFNAVPIPTATTGSYTGTITGCTTSPTETISYVSSGNLVTVWGPALACASNSLTMSLTGAPAGIRPSFSVGCAYHSAIGRLEDNSGLITDGMACMNNSGTINLTRASAANFNGFTNAGQKGVGGGAIAVTFGWSFTYTLQ